MSSAAFELEGWWLDFNSLQKQQDYLAWTYKSNSEKLLGLGISRMMQE